MMSCFPGFDFPLRAMLADDADYTCGEHVHIDLHLSHSLSAPPLQICEWHVSLHLARTCIAYGHCVMARGHGNAAPRYDSRHVGESDEGQRNKLLM